MGRLTLKAKLGRTGLRVPPILFGTSCLGNLYEALAPEVKLEILRQWFACVEPAVVADSAGKYGAGLALEVIGDGLRRLGIPPADILISNKLGWKRVPLRGPEPTFEPGVWAGLRHDAEQRIGYDGILECWHQGCELLGPGYAPQLVSVHDPDEYLAAAATERERGRRFADILDAYRALHELRQRGEVRAVGVGSKDWRVIRRIADAVPLDWVMLACSLTVYTHPRELLDFAAGLHRAGTGIINSAVFNAGFLTGGAYFDYRRPDPVADAALFAWRERFLAVCGRFAVRPADACVRFALSPPGVVSIALNTGRPERIRGNVASVQAVIPDGFWLALKDAGLIARDYPYLAA
ncbi:MAG: Pyridoxal 4-dehydrogenase [Lentisphaerae bacterium ADurb.BinA184]|nr:MAG: Pyridoxal 4-dehydrogenase [Lentisphaerae bacterium ADurb.BinA184]